MQATTNSKQKIVAALLAFFFGYLGIHRFYLGYIGIGIAQLLCTVLCFFTLGISLIVVGIWAFVEFVLILCGNIKDSNGQQLI
ncbi:MAG: TM2 domain-containing protein [Clostridium sp.]|nr:TM2 domain-containing protein [Clostridium sp.]